MNKLKIIIQDGKLLTDSREVAEMVGKRHDHLLRDIDNYMTAMKNGGLPKVGGSDFFTENTYQNSQNKTMPCYLITRKGCEMVANKMTGEKGVLFTATYINAFHEMESNLQKSVVPQTLPEALRLAADLAEEKQFLLEQSERQQHLIGELQPKADYVDYILSSIGTMTSGQIAADYGLTANKLNKILFEERLHRKVGDQWILYEKHMGLGYTKSETIPIVRSDSRPDTKLFTKWTQKGRLKINEILNKLGIYANMDIVNSGK